MYRWFPSHVSLSAKVPSLLFRYASLVTALHFRDARRNLLYTVTHLNATATQIASLAYGTTLHAKSKVLPKACTSHPPLNAANLIKGGVAIRVPCMHVCAQNDNWWYRYTYGDLSFHSLVIVINSRDSHVFSFCNNCLHLCNYCQENSSFLFL